MKRRLSHGPLGLHPTAPPHSSLLDGLAAPDLDFDLPFSAFATALLGARR